MCLIPYSRRQRPSCVCSAFKFLFCPLFFFRFVRWPYIRRLPWRIHNLQRRMYSIVPKLHPHAGDSSDQLIRRRNMESAKHQAVNGRWSVLWSTRQASWSEHVVRNTANACWSTTISNFLRFQCLEWRRAANHGRPLTRNSFGRISQRWYEGLVSILC